VPGNLDKQARRQKEDFLWLDNLAELSIHGQSIVLCHYALRVWNRSNRGSWHLYGHSHGRPPEVRHSLSMDVGVDAHASAHGIMTKSPINKGKAEVRKKLLPSNPCAGV
jgi:calcineurin-like phosphoesterase family protein